MARTNESQRVAPKSVAGQRIKALLHFQELTRHIELIASYYPSYSTAKHALSLSSAPHASNSRLELALISWGDLGRPFPELG